MTPAPATVSDELTLTDALDRMYSDNIRHLPVLNAERGLVGTISTRDIAVAGSVLNLDPDKALVREAMSRAPYVCEVNTPLLVVAHHLEHERVSSAIVTQGGLPVGIFTTTDALRALRTLLVGYAVEPATKPTHIVDEKPSEEAPQHRPHKRSVAVNRNYGTVSWFLARF
jgi:acetoin utilization protein AcuB